MNERDFRFLAERLRGYTRFLYFHLMGEPLLHPALDRLLDAAGESGFKVNITTNGTLLRDKAPVLLNAKSLHRVNISLQSFEANDNCGLESYINQCADFAGAFSGRGGICSLRLWNSGGEDSLNPKIIVLLRGHFPKSWKKGTNGFTLKKGIFLEYGETFDWPDVRAENRGSSCFCHGLRDHIGVLCDGTVVPCCLDRNGEIALGNLFEMNLDEILASPRARAIYDGFSRRRTEEELCRHCGYARRF